MSSLVCNGRSLSKGVMIIKIIVNLIILCHFIVIIIELRLFLKH